MRYKPHNGLKQGIYDLRMWIDDDEYHLQVDTDALYHGDFIVEGYIADQVA